MKKSFLLLLLSLLLFLFLNTSLIAQESSEKATNDTTKTEKKEEEKSKNKKPKEPKFEELIEDFTRIEGLFTIYSNEKEGKVYLEISQDQFGPLYLCNITRQSGDGSLFDSGAMLDEFPFFIKQVGKKIQFIRKNVKFRASKNAAINRAVEQDFPNSLWASAKIASQPHEERGSILIDATEIFMQDYNLVGYRSEQAKMPYSFDKGDSYFSELNSFPENTEIEVTLHFKSTKPLPVFTLSDSRSMLHRYHYSLSTLPETDYKPRIADDRLGHFLTLFQDYTSVLEDTPYKYYITRWQLEKSEPKFKLSKPKKPIVFWIENTVPVEYRDAVQEGILLWNDAFRKIGFDNAIMVEQMPDDAKWDPADVRYNTIRWIVQPGKGYAVGPSRANPFTGQIYDADVRVSADFIRFYYKEFSEFITPLSWSSVKTDQLWPVADPFDTPTLEQLPYYCNYSNGLSQQMGFAWNLLSARGTLGNNPDDLKKFIHDGIVDLIVHEVGHTLGLRHNFKASSTIQNEKLFDKNFTKTEGISGSVMDYNPVNLSIKKNSEGNFFQTVLGKYDYWVIEYAYKPWEPDSKISETEMLEKIADKVAEPALQYGTDEDAFGFSTRGVDPYCSLFDLGSDPVQYYNHRIDLANELWKSIPEKFDTKGERYQKFRVVFSQGLTEYALAAANLPKFLGGISVHRDHIGDPNGRVPFQIIPAQKQRDALKTITDKFFSADAFQFSPDLLNKLAPENFWDFEMTVFRRLRVDYPIHGIVQVLQASALFRLYDPILLQRLQDDELRYSKDEDRFTMADLFQDIRKAIWQELETGKNINSYKRELQRMHLYVLTKIVLSSVSMLPHDAVTLARADMNNIKNQIDARLKAGNLDTYTKAHLEETRAKIEAALEAQIQRSL
jgi:hypothetical protein